MFCTASCSVLATHLVFEALDVQHQHVRKSVDPQMLGGAGLVLALLAVERLLALRW